MPKHTRIPKTRQSRRCALQVRSKEGVNSLPKVRRGFNIHDYPWLVATERADTPIDEYFVPLVEVWSLKKSRPDEYGKKKPDRRSEASWFWRNPA
jgi:hypothetical protein